MSLPDKGQQTNLQNVGYSTNQTAFAVEAIVDGGVYVFQIRQLTAVAHGLLTTYLRISSTRLRSKKENTFRTGFQEAENRRGGYDRAGPHERWNLNFSP